MNSFYWAKAAFVSLLMISSIIFEASCLGPVSKLFNSLIVGIISANEGEHSAASISNQRPLELKLADAQMLQQWIGQIARKIVVEDGIFAGNYLCCPNININAVILTDGLPQERIKKIDKKILKDFKEVQNLEQKGQFLKLLFSFGAMLSAEIGEQSQQNGTIRALLKAYECVVEQFPEEKDGISDFVIGAVIKSPIVQLKVDKLILETNNRRRIHEFDLLNGLNIQMTPKDIINFASFIKINFLTYPLINPFENSFLKENGLSLSTLNQDPDKSRRIAHQLLIHLKNWGTDELKEFSLKESFEDVIKLTEREKCIFGIFARNLMQRMAKSELLDDYFGELNISALVEYIQDYLKYYERLSSENCKKEKENKGIENSKIYPFFDETIRIDWNVWKGIIREIDELTKTVKSRNSKKEFLERAMSSETMEIIMAKFSDNKIGLKLKAEMEEMLKLNDETTPIDEIVNQFCLNLAKIRQICEENIEQYEPEIPLKRNVIIKQKETYNKSYDLMAKNYNKFYDFIAIFVKHFGRNSFKNDKGKSIEFDLKGAKSFLEKVYISANEFLQNKDLNFETAIRAILDKNLNENAEKLLKEFYEPKEFVKIPRKSAKKEGGLKHLVEAQLFNLFFSFAARLEAIVHGKNIDGTIEKSRENSKDKIGAFLAVPNCFNVPEWANEFSIFDYWMEIKVINSKKSQKMPVIGVEIFRKIIKKNEEAKSISGESYKTLKSLNEYKFSFYESTKLLRQIHDRIEEKRNSSRGLKIPEIIKNSIDQIDSENAFKRTNYAYGGYIKECEFAKLFKNVSANFMEMKGIDLKLHMDKDDIEIQAEVERDFEKYCKEIERIDRIVEGTKIALLNNVRYDLVINFKLNAWKDVRDRTDDLLEAWAVFKADEKRAIAEGNEKYMTQQIYNLFYFTSHRTNRERISKIKALKAKENDGFDLMGLFDNAHNLAWKIIKEEIPNLEKAKEELKTLEQSENAANYKKKQLFEETENFKRQIQDKENEANNLKNEINLLQEKLNEMPKKQRENAANFSEWFKSNEEAKITDERKQILQEIYELSKLYIKVRKLKAKISGGNGSKSQKRIENDKNLTMANIIAVTVHKSKIELKMDLVKLKLEVLGNLLELAKEIDKNLHNNLLELAQEIDKNLDKNLLYELKWEKIDYKLNKTQLTKKMDVFEYEERVEKLRKRIEKVSHGVEGELDALLNEYKIKLGEKELKSKEEELKNLKEKLLKMKKEFAPKIEEIDKKLSKLMEKEQTLKEYKLNILKGSISKMNETIAHKNAQIEKINKILREILMKKEEVNTLEKELEGNKESAREMWKSLGQMFENVKKHYGQKMDE